MGALVLAAEVLAVGVAGGIGSVLRLIFSRWSGYLPWGILLANSVASLVAGFLVWVLPNPIASLVVITGLLGGLSTFSSWAAATAEYWMAKQRLRMVLNWGFNLVIPMLSAMLGVAVGTLL
ncbi:MAG: CrcB family protein, partial [Actinomycetes bacterium]